MKHEGQCLCGTVRYRYHDELPELFACHCLQCRQSTGSAFASVLPARLDAMEWMSGESCLKAYESSPGKYRYFCQNCGSPVYSQLASAPEQIRLRAGLLTTPLPLTAPHYHIFTDSKAGWDVLPADAICYAGFRPVGAQV